MLEQFTTDIWVAERSQRFWGVETGTRMTIVRFEDGTLFVHCPVALDEGTRRDVDALGEVRIVVAASLYHHLYVGSWIDAYPRAEVWACPGLTKKRSDLAWTGTLENGPLESWEHEIDQAPLTARFEREIVFFHRKTRTLICADALLNLSKHPSAVTRTVAMLMLNTAPGKGWMERIAVRDYALGRRQLDRILEWDIDKIALAHGAPVQAGGRQVLRDAYAWLPCTGA